MLSQRVQSCLRRPAFLVPSARLSIKAPGVNQTYKISQGTFPEFKGKDNSSPKVDLTRHNKKDWTLDEVKVAMKDHSVFSWGASTPLLQSSAHVERGEGIYLFDKVGKKYIDWSAGAVCTNLGHTMPKSIKDAISEQINKTPFVYGDLVYHDARARLCALLAEVTPGDINSFLFASGGAEANEAAVRMARRYTGRQKIMSRYRSYHGGTTSALSVTGDWRRWAVDGSATGFVKIMDPFPFNFLWDADEDAGVQRCLNALHDQILFEGPHTIAAIFLEPVTGANGWLKPPTAFMQGIRALCDKYDILLVSDEVMTGFGRTGHMFGFQNFDGVIPDMITFAKGVTSAYLPLSGVGLRDKLFDFFRENPVGYGATYFAHPVCCAAAYATVKHILDTDLVGHVRRVEPVMVAEMAKLVKKHPSVRQARCHGLGGGIDLQNKQGEFLSQMHETTPGLSLLKKRLLEVGLITLMRGHFVHCAPPLIITEAQIQEGAALLSKGLEALDEFIMKQ